MFTMETMESQEPREMLAIADVARVLGVSRQVVMNWHLRGKLPREDYFYGIKRRPLWERSTLEKAGVL